MLCSFAPQQTSLRWEVLARVANRCGAPQLVASIPASPGQTVTIPSARPGEAVFGRVSGLGVSGLERVEALLYRARLRHATVNKTEVVRIVPGTAQDGLLFDLAPLSDYPTPFALSPHVHTISFASGSGQLLIDVYRMTVSRTIKPPG